MNINLFRIPNFFYFEKSYRDQDLVKLCLLDTWMKGWTDSFELACKTTTAIFPFL